MKKLMHIYLHQLFYMCVDENLNIVFKFVSVKQFDLNGHNAYILMKKKTKFVILLYKLKEIRYNKSWFKVLIKGGETNGYLPIAIFCLGSQYR